MTIVDRLFLSCAPSRTLALGVGVLLPVAAAVMLVGCSGLAANDGFVIDAGNDETSPATAREGGASRLPSVDGGLPSLGDAESSGDCPASAKLIYLTGIGSRLWSFLPPSTFHDIGPLTCLDSPTHMTVDRQGNAWIVSDGNLYKASTADASCAAVANWRSDPFNFPDFALTFLGTTSATDNTLYMFGDPTGDLGKFDLVSGAITVIGMPNVPSPAGDMTTNGDGTLYFLMDVTAPQLFEFDPASAAVITSYTLNASGGGDQALAFYGGSFYAFEDDVISVYDTKAGTTTAGGLAPLMVTGAGQSTCVPLVAPVSK